MEGKGKQVGCLLKEKQALYDEASLMEILAQRPSMCSHSCASYKLHTVFQPAFQMRQANLREIVEEVAATFRLRQSLQQDQLLVHIYFFMRCLGI